MANETPGIPAHRFLPFVALAALAVAFPITGMFIPPPGILNILIRITGIAGALCLILALVSSAFVKQIFKATHHPFKQIHHLLAISGAVLITLHPLLLAWQMKTLKFFIPVINSWPEFLSWGGRVGIILIYLAILAAVIMKKIPAFWRQFHWLMYPGLLLGGIHALRLGQDITSLVAKSLTWGLLGLIVIVFIYKRLRKPPVTKTKVVTQTPV